MSLWKVINALSRHWRWFCWLFNVKKPRCYCLYFYRYKRKRLNMDNLPLMWPEDDTELLDEVVLSVIVNKRDLTGSADPSKRRIMRSSGIDNVRPWPKVGRCGISLLRRARPMRKWKYVFAAVRCRRIIHLVWSGWISSTSISPFRDPEYRCSWKMPSTNMVQWRLSYHHYDQSGKEDACR